MKSRKPIPRAAVLAALVMAGTALTPPGVAQAAPADPETGALARQHGWLAARQGELRLTSTFWSAPGAAPEVSQLAARRSLLLGGRVLRLDVGSEEGWFSGTGLEGYDAVAKRFWYVWSDTSTTGVSILYGQLGADGTASYAGRMPTPSGDSPLRVEIRNEGATEVHDCFVPAAGGGERRMLELRYAPAVGQAAPE